MTELTLESVREFLVSNDGKVKNKDMVKHFKQILSDSHNKAENRQKFKEFINELASVRTEDGEKMIILKTKKKKKFMSLDDLPPPPPSPPRENSPVSDVSSRDIPPTPTESSITVESGPTESGESSIKVESTPTDSGVGLDIAPTNESNIDNASSLQTTDEESPNRPNVKDFAKQLDDQIETDKLEQSTVVLRKKKFENHDSTENNENLSLEPLDHKFMIAAACADYHPMAKMLQQNPKLVSQQDLTSTPLHWACKHGNLDVVKMLAGKYKANVNVKSGYTPLHLAAQGNHEDIIDVLIGAYKADVSIRDYSGKKAKHYLRNSASAIKLFNIEEEKKVLLDKEVKEAVKNVGDPKYQNITSLLGSQGSNIRASFRAYRTQIHNRRNSNNSPTLSPKLKKCKEPGSSSETGKKRKDSKKGKEMFGFGVPTTSRVKSESDMNKKSFFI